MIFLGVVNQLSLELLVFYLMKRCWMPTKARKTRYALCVCIFFFFLNIVFISVCVGNGCRTDNPNILKKKNFKSLSLFILFLY